MIDLYFIGCPPAVACKDVLTYLMQINTLWAWLGCGCYYTKTLLLFPTFTLTTLWKFFLLKFWFPLQVLFLSAIKPGKREGWVLSESKGYQNRGNRIKYGIHTSLQTVKHTKRSTNQDLILVRREKGKVQQRF